MRDFTSRIAWQSLVHSFNLVGSHDVPRIRTLVGPEGVEAAAGLLFTFPSMPMLTYGDEIGMEGTFGEDGRRPMPWDQSNWDATTLAVYRGLIAARKGSVALRRGGLRWVHAEGDAIVFLRETEQEVALVHVARAAHPPVSLALNHLAGIEGGAPLYGPPPEIGEGAATLSADDALVRIWTWKPTDGGARHARRRGPVR